MMARSVRAAARRPDPFVWTARTASLFVLVHLGVSVPVLWLRGRLATEHRELLEAFSVYAAPGWTDVLGQLARGVVLALVLYPFYRSVLGRKRAWIVLFAFFWLLNGVGSVEPLPGSIEGWIYTETTLVGHALILAASAVQALLLAMLLPRIEAIMGSGDALGAPRPAGRHAGTTLRFVALHVLTYLVVGVAFFALQDYREAFATQPQFAHYRPLDHPIVAMAVPLQLVRGAVLAAAMLPFVHAARVRRRGWLLVFATLFGGTALGSASLLPDVVNTLASAPERLASYLLVGLPELVVQMAAFSWLLIAWERRAAARRGQDRPDAGRGR